MATIRKSARIALTLLVSLMLIQFTTKSAEAGHRHHHHRHFHHHHGFHIGWSGFGGYGWYAGYRPWGWHHAWQYRPVHVQRYYYAPYNCYGWDGYSARGAGYGSTWLSSNDSQIPTTMPDVQTNVVAENETNGGRLTDTLSQIALTVEVPDDARVYVNELETKSVGGRRSYVTRGASSNDRYDFVVRAEVERDGTLITESKTVRLLGGQTSLLSFELVAPQTQIATTQDPIDTMLKVRVPDGAKVYLSGTETRQTGEERIFVTRRLRAGEMWEGYRIRVTWNEDGREQTREKRITLVAGDTRELEFGDETKLVAARLAN